MSPSVAFSYCPSILHPYTIPLSYSFVICPPLYVILCCLPETFSVYQLWILSHLLSFSHQFSSPYFVFFYPRFMPISSFFHSILILCIFYAFFLNTFWLLTLYELISISILSSHSFSLLTTCHVITLFCLLFFVLFFYSFCVFVLHPTFSPPPSAPWHLNMWPYHCRLSGWVTVGRAFNESRIGLGVFLALLACCATFLALVMAYALIWVS